MGSFKRVAVALLLLAGCATGSVGERGCAEIVVDNRGYENIRVAVDGRRIGMVRGFSSDTLSLCNFRRLRSVEISAIGGRYAFSIPRQGEAHLFDDAVLHLYVGEREFLSGWLR